MFSFFFVVRCHNWFHVDCLGMTEESANKLEVYECKKCLDEEAAQAALGPPPLIPAPGVAGGDAPAAAIAAPAIVAPAVSADGNVAVEDPEKLYCICKKPYEEGRVMVGCDSCDDWLHIECVGLTPEQADAIETYVCKRCKNKRKSSGSARKRKR